MWHPGSPLFKVSIKQAGLKLADLVKHCSYLTMLRILHSWELASEI